MSVTGSVLVPPANVNEIDAWYKPGTKPVILAMAVRLAGEVKLPVETLSHAADEVAAIARGMTESTDKVRELVGGTAP